MKTEKLLEALKVALVAQNQKEVVKLEAIAENLVCARWCGAQDRLIALHDGQVSVDSLPPQGLVAVYRKGQRATEFALVDADSVPGAVTFDELCRRSDVFYVKVFSGGGYVTRKSTYSLNRFLRQKQHRLRYIERKGGGILSPDVVRQIFSHYFEVLDVDVPVYWEDWAREGDYFVYKTDRGLVPVRIVVAKDGDFYLLYYGRNAYTKVSGVYYDQSEYYVFADVKSEQSHADVYVLTKKETVKFLNKVRNLVRKGTLTASGANRYRIEHLALVGAKPQFRLDLQTKTVTKYE